MRLDISNVFAFLKTQKQKSAGGQGGKDMASALFTCDGVEWKRVRVLGKGSFGEAILIQGTSPPHPLAVCKLVHLAAMKREEQKEALTEVRVLSQLKHPNIVEYIGSFESGGYLHILMEYCNAGDVEQLIKKQKGTYLEENVVASLFIQVCSALRYLHERRILHRDLKTQNIFLSIKEGATTTDDGPSNHSEKKIIAKLGDFGISTILRNTLALAKTICGTPYYFSPELCLNRPYNNKSDIWSLGCILYEMVTLKHAFDANSMKALMARILSGQYAPVPSVYHATLQPLIDGMLQQKVDKRLSIQQVMKTAFVEQHVERMYQAHDLDASLKKQQQQIKIANGMHLQPKRAGGSSGASDVDMRLKQAMERRQENEAKQLERKQAIEDQRRRKNIRAAQNYDKYREQHLSKVAELERLDDIRRRIEICSYEDQERYVQQGWKLVQETQERQKDRSKANEERDRQLASLMEQMKAVDAKMQSRRLRREQQFREGAVPPCNVMLAPPQPPPPPAYSEHSPPRITREPTAKELAQAYKNRVSAEAPWNRGREAPVGFTKESWEAHCRVMGHGGGLPVAPPAVQGRGLSQPATPNISSEPPVLCRLSDNDVSVLLKVERKRLESDPQFLQLQQQREEDKKKELALREWEEYKKQIREAEGLPVNRDVSQPEVAWLLEKKKLDEAKQKDAMSRRPPLASGGVSPQRPPSGGVAGSSPHAAQPPRALPNRSRFAEDAPVPRFTTRSKEMSPPAVPQRYAPSESPSDSSDEYSDTSTSGGSDDEEYDCVIQEMKAQQLRPEPPELFEEAALPPNDLSRMANTIKFTLDGKTLHLDGVTSSNAPEARVEALRVFLMDALGGQRSFERLQRHLQEIQSADVDETLADAMLRKLEEQYGTKSGLVDLMIQWMVCEAMVNASTSGGS